MEQTIKGNKILLFVVSNKNYIKNINEIAYGVSNVSRSIVYVTLNKPYKVLVESFEKKGINAKKMAFIDCASGSIQKPKDYDVLFVSSPEALTELSITINETMKKSTNIIIFDSVSTLLVYKEPSIVVKFIHSMISKIRAADKKCVMISLSEDANKTVLKDIGMFIDKMVVLK